jgi:soluble lytic murein transglycosylase-like protein
MSALAIEPTATEGVPADAASASLRVQQLQALVAQAASGSTASFAAALNAASTSPGAGGQSEVPAQTTGAQTAGQTPATATAAAYAPTTAATAAYMSPTAATAAYMSPTAASLPAGAVPAAGAESTGSSPYDAAIAQAAARYGIEPALLHGLIQQESGFDPNAHSSSGALGLTQLMPGTASSLGVSDPLDPTQSIEGGARYLSEMLARFGGNTADALAAYNAGPGAVSKYGGVPPYAETQDYVSKVLGYADAYRQSLSGAPTAGALATQPGAPANGVPTTQPGAQMATPSATAATGSIT